ncbi:MAG TPA: hypothetical protein VFI47_16230, partial [Acidimicrobiales bacterium]|nr:hypothetical protein [Acidimicrobiales bacterium]
PIAAAWATITHLGLDGYLRLAGQVRDAARRLRAGVEAIDGLTVTGDPIPAVMEIAADGAAGGPPVDIGAVGDVMDDRGWFLDRQQGGLHAIVSPSHGAVAGEFLADLADAVAAGGAGRGVTARYGGVG